MVYRELLQMEWLESSTVPLPKSLPIIISPCEICPYEAVKWSFSIVGHYLLVEPRIGLSLKDCAYE